MRIRSGQISKACALLGLAALVCLDRTVWAASKVPAAGSSRSVAAPPVMAVHEVLRDDDEDFVPDLLGRTVTVKGVLTSLPLNNGRFAIVHFQDDTGGLLLFTANPRLFENIEEGDMVIVTGDVGQSHGLEQLEVKNIRMLRSGESPQPRDVRIADLLSERFSGQLIRVSGEIVARGAANSAAFMLKDAQAEIPILIPPAFLTWQKGELNFKLWKGGHVVVTGIAGQEKISPPFNAGYVLLPRKPDDFTFLPPPPPPPSPLPLYIACAAAVLLALIALYMWERRRAAEARTREVSRLLREIERSENEVKKQAAFAQLNPNPVLELFADGTMTYCNDAARDLAESLGKAGVEELLPAEVKEIVRQCIAMQRSRVKCDVTIDGRTLCWSFFPIHEITSVHAYGQDITEQLNLEMQLRQAQKLESIGQLAAGIAHDFNNLLSVIQGYTGLAMLRHDLPPRLAEPLNEIAGAAERASNLTRQLLTFSRRQKIEARHLNLNEVVANVSKMLRRLIGEHIRLQLQCAAGYAWVHADPGMIEQVVINLAINARDAMPEGGELIISIQPHLFEEPNLQHHFEARPGTFVCLSVTDNGCGMDADTLKRLFEPFFTTKKPGEGTGLGLATVHGIVKQHQGWIEVSSTPGKGTTFNVYFPSASEPATIEEKNVIPLPVTGGSETIMVVEDDPALRKLARSALEEYGYGVVEAGSATEALSRWTQHREQIQLLFTDIVLPDGMSGWNLAERLRSDSPELKVIYATGFDLHSVVRRRQSHPNLVLLRKPYPIDALVGAVRSSLDNVPAVQALNTSSIS